MMSRSHLRSILLACAVLSATAAAAVRDGPYETHPVLEAQSLLSPGQLEATSYRIEPAVTSDSFLYRFEIITPSGSFAAERLEQVPIRLREAKALAILVERSAGEVIAESAGDTVEGAVGSVVKVVEEPGATAKGAASGVGRWAKRTVLGARKLAVDVKDGIDEARSDEDAEDEAEQATPAAGTTAEPAQEPEPEANAAGATAKAVGKWVIGYSTARRNYAAKLGVDPYTRNPVLAAELDRVAWSASASSFGVGLMIPDLPLTPEVQDVYGLVWKHHPGDLQVRNRKIATEWGVDRKTRDRFFWSDVWTPTEQTRFVEAIAGLGATPGKRSLMGAAASVTEPADVARWIAEVELLERLHNDGTRFARVEAVEDTLWALEADVVVVPLAVDHLVWTRELEGALRHRVERIRRRGESHRRRVLVVTGVVSERAHAALADEGWALSEAGPVGQPPT